MIKLYHDDCFNIFPQLEDKSIDLVLCDMPYGTTACKWDTVIDLERMWKDIKRIVKDNTAIVLFGSEPFSSILRMSNLKQYKYDWVWVKSRPLGFLNAKLKPLNNYEILSIFSTASCANGAKQLMNYNPQDLIKIDKYRNGQKTGKNEHNFTRKSHKERHFQEYTNYPKRVLEFHNEGNTTHPTQKPVALMEYLIKTYSNEGDTVLDFCMGSGTTGVACKNLNRSFIGIEKEENYFNIAKERIDLA